MLATALALGSLAPQLTPAQALTASPPVSYDDFGRAVAVHGLTAVVGVPGRDATGFDEGAAYVFERAAIGAPWGASQALLASVPEDAAQFGAAVALGEGALAVGSPRATHLGMANAGLVYVFERDSSGAWAEAAVLASTASQPTGFGSSLALDGDRLAVGAFSAWVGNVPSAGAVYVFERQAGGPEAWGQVAELNAPTATTGAWFGLSVALSGDWLLVGAPRTDAGGLAQSGAAHLFERQAGVWSFERQLFPLVQLPTAAFGQALDLEGDVAVIGSPFGSLPGPIEEAHVYGRDQGGPGAWQQLQLLRPSDGESDTDFGALIALEGGTLIVGAPLDDSTGAKTGAAYVFERSPTGSIWTEATKLTADPFAEQLGSAGGVSAGQILLGAPQADLGPKLAQVEGLAYDPASGTLYGSDVSTRVLVTIDPTTGAATVVGPIGFSFVEGLAFDPLAGVLWGADRGTNELIRIDPSTGAGTAVGPFGVDSIRGLAFDPGIGTLYGSRDGPDRLFTIDLTTGMATKIGPTGNGPMSGLTFDTTTGMLFGSNPESNELFVLDPATGAATLVGPLSPSLYPAGLAFDDASARLFGAAMDRLVQIDEQSGATVELGPFSDYALGAGAVYAYDLDAPSASYCVAGVSASGCQATLASSGTASASSPAGFLLAAMGVEGAKDGIFFFGVNGRQAKPWGNSSSSQCVVPPAKRAGLLLGRGTPGACDGSFEQDLNALWSAKPGKNPGAGTLAQAQLWYRDPLSTSNQTTSLSDALEFFVAP